MAYTENSAEVHLILALALLLAAPKLEHTKLMRASKKGVGKEPQSL